MNNEEKSNEIGGEYQWMRNEVDEDQFREYEREFDYQRVAFKLMLNVYIGRKQVDLYIGRMYWIGGEIGGVVSSHWEEGGTSSAGRCMCRWRGTRREEG